MAVLECVPNLSEGRRPEVIAELASAAAAEAVLLDTSSDVDHHRTVLTLAGEPEALRRAILGLFAVAERRIDLRRHAGAHPRVGAVDVVPFVPLAGAAMDAAVAAAVLTARGVADRFDLPVFLYGRAARFGPRELPDLRRGGTEGLAARLAAGLEPDFGPSRLHPALGAVAVGARDFLVAWNVVLESDDVAIAKAVARAVRERDGGLPGVRALGVHLPSRGRVQVSMNLVDLARTPPHAAFRRVREEAARRGVGVASSEIVGLVPSAALEGGPLEELCLEQPLDDRRLEPRLRAAGIVPV